jgi:hypothetical protein
MAAEPGAIDTRQLELGRGGGLGTSGGRRHFHKAQRQGGPACGVAICFCRSVRRNRNCLATRAGGKIAAKATA